MEIQKAIRFDLVSLTDNTTYFNKAVLDCGYLNALETREFLCMVFYY